MYKIVLVDDEAIVREGMREIIPWGQLGLEVVGSCEDGEEALAIIRKTRPDIILLDINMPKINGIELAKIIKKENTEIKIVFITGYDEFSYAKSALTIGVEDYVLKPISKNEMIKILERIVEKVKIQKEKYRYEAAMLTKVEQFIPLARQKYLEEIFFEDLEERAIKRRCEKADIPLDKNDYGIFLMDSDYPIKGSKSDTLTKFAITNIVKEIITRDKRGILFDDQAGVGVLYYESNHDTIVERSYLNYINNIKDILTKHLEVTVTIGVGSLVQTVSRLPESYYEAKQALASRFFRGEGRIIIEKKKEEQVKEVNLQKLILWEEQISSTLQTKGSIENIFESICQDMKNTGLSMNQCRYFWEGIVTGMLRQFIQIDETIVSFFKEPLIINQALVEKKTLVEVKEWVEKLYKDCVQYVESQAAPNKMHMKQILYFIEKNYALPELSMKMVCEEVHLSPSYFSNILKKETGLTFVQVVTEYRMDKACELLLYTNLKTYEIADTIGFIDPHYFSSAFKKKFSMTPSEYRKQYEGKAYE